MSGKRSTTAVVEEAETEATSPEAEVDPRDVDPIEAAREKLAARAAALSDTRVRTLCESLLFVAERPLSEKAIQEATGIVPGRIREAMAALAGHYREGVSGIVLHEVSGGWQLRTCPTSSEYVRRHLQVKPQRLTRAALEALSIVAYRQPVTRPEVEEIRGVDCGAVLKALLERGLLEVLGKKEEPGRPLLYGTTKAFLEFFNLKDLSSLPTLREFHELNEEHQQILEDSYPGEAEAKTERPILEGLDAPTGDDHRPDDEAALEALDAAVRDTEDRARAVAATLDGVKREAAAEAEADAADAADAAGDGDAAPEEAPEA